MGHQQKRGLEVKVLGEGYFLEDKEVILKIIC